MYSNLIKFIQLLIKFILKKKYFQLNESYITIE